MYTREQAKRKRYLQRVIGILVLAATALMIILASVAKAEEDRDATAALVTAPAGLALTFSKSTLI